MSERAKATTKVPETKSNSPVSKSQKTNVSPSINSPVDQILFLQRTIGNQAVQRLLKGVGGQQSAVGGYIQAKLKIGPPHDIYEQEADRVAEQVMRMPEPQGETPVSMQTHIPRIQRMCPECEEELQRQPMEEEEELLQTKGVSGNTPEVTPSVASQINSIRSGGHPLSESVRAFFEPRFGQDFSRIPIHSSSARAIQIKLAINKPGDIYEQEADAMADKVMRMEMPSVQTTPLGGSTLQRKCAQCEEEEKEKEKTIQRKENSNASPPFAPPVVNNVLNSSTGKPMDPGTRSFVESRFNFDFSKVKIHDNYLAAASASSINALAYTSGNNIVFNKGQYSPATITGKKLLAHELTHVLQQKVQTKGNADPFPIQRSPGSPAGGCGVCYGSPKFAGIEAHTIIQKGLKKALGRNAIVAERLVPSPGDENGRLDIAISVATDKVLIAEIKPNNKDGIKEGEKDISYYKKQLKALGMKVETLVWIPNIPVLHFLTLGMGQSCPSFQKLSISATPAAPGVILYDCDPDFKVLIKRCKCLPSKKGEKKEGKEKKTNEEKPKDNEKPKEKENPREKEKDKEPGPSDTLPGKLLKLGGEFALLLAADGLLAVALEFVGALAVALSPLLALAALAFAIVFLWDKVKWLAQKIAGPAKWVWGKVSWILDKIKTLGIKIGELAVWLGGKIKWLAEKLAEGLMWAGRKIVAGAKWVGRKIASAAEAVWDWLFGSGPEPMVPNIEFPVTEDPMHCGTVAHEDALVKIGADLLFPFNEWKLKPEADTPLKEAAAKVLSMLRNSDDPVRIQGYADNVGGFEYNQHLSEQRAGAVADWFVEHGAIPRSQIKITGFGKTRAQYNDPEGRKKDRRVEIWVTKHGSTEKVCW